MSIFSFDVDAQGVCVIKIDSPGERLNRLSYNDILQLEEILKRVEKQEVKATLLISGKEDDFISGFDVNYFLNITSIDEGRMFSLKAQEVLEKFRDSKIPFIAAINGACLGIGLEIALSCAYRIATDDTKTTFGFPEADLGLIPFAGGTQLLPNLIGVQHALHIITGEKMNSKGAKDIGLVDEIVPKEILLDIAKKRAIEIYSKKLKPSRPRVKDFTQLMLEKNPLGRKILFNKLRKKIVKEVHEYYLAPTMGLEAIEIGMNSTLKRGLHVESAYFGELVVSDLFTRLAGIFLAKDLLANDAVTENNMKPVRLEKTAVVGVGFMGSQIAALAADAGITVRMKDEDDLSLGRGLKACREYFQERCENNSITKVQMEKRFNLVSGTCDYSGFRRADLVIESVPEDLELKQKVLEEIESVVKEGCIIASNTSSLPIAQIANRLKRQGNVIGMRFFSPVHSVELVEIVRAPDTSEGTIVAGIAFSRRLGKTPIVVKDGTGFYTTRILFSYINEAMHLLSEGAIIDDIDMAMVKFGFPVGPLMLLDQMGFDLYMRVANNIYEAFGERLNPPLQMDVFIQEGRIGRKGDKGFYTYNGGLKVDKSVYDLLPFRHAREIFSKEEIQERLSLAMVNEAVLSLEED
ncbi:MAG TPA: 3-hydroxyacyl-CoA dehydrogenase NAD-binding domain-containing protein, partial [Thermodesulfobacteriota bacterium]|nr:3-hydroxyacyl-CoA dehydrogenase NAD-binding domain-containing protein [Thermodesulfobacteriota bacterium]